MNERTCLECGKHFEAEDGFLCDECKFEAVDRIVFDPSVAMEEYRCPFYGGKDSPDFLLYK